MGKSVRVNLSIPGRVDSVLQAYADLTGRTKAAVVMEAVGLQLSTWSDRVRSQRSRSSVVDVVGLERTGGE